MSGRERDLVFLHVEEERLRQLRKWGEQTHPDGTRAGYAIQAAAHRGSCDRAAREGTVTWRDIALEELYEALVETDQKKLRKELIQTIAVLVGWVEDLDTREVRA